MNLVNKLKHFLFTSYFQGFSSNPIRFISFFISGFSSAVIITIFQFYHVDLFISVYQLDPTYFYYSQIIYAVWNAINDPLFGWIIENTSPTEGRRIPAIKWGGLLWALVFLIPWFPWGTSQVVVCIHFIVSICCFDAFLTYVLLVTCALLADLTFDSTERNNLNNTSSIGGLIGSFVGSLSYLLWDKQDLSNFKIYAIFCAVVSGCGFYFSAKYLSMSNIKNGGNLLVDNNNRKAQPSILTFLKQLLRHKNFWVYVSMNFLQNFNAFLDANFFTIADEKLFGTILPHTSRLIFVVLVLYLPKVMTQILTPFANRYGVYQLIWNCTLSKLIFSFLMVLAGIQSSYVIWAFLFVLIRLSNSSWSFYNLAFSDVIDEDKMLNKREESISVAVHGIQALFVKPAQSLAPILGVYVLSSTPFYKQPLQSLTPSQLSVIQSNIFQLLALSPLICGALQLLVWRNFSLHGLKLKELKQYLYSKESKV
eukprot:TRINITY_DN225_c0_g1_i8.p1 TRINITY_DN225_c0_g1~~TRINITY_DN225_c0_g1_i8.p1  ORF type:complete len:480 (-),score=71.28 TRINITY_DN225_c0_g1_i8:354-1793(-)